MSTRLEMVKEKTEELKAYCDTMNERYYGKKQTPGTFFAMMVMAHAVYEDMKEEYDASKAGK